jgi:hypothetical protein
VGTTTARKLRWHIIEIVRDALNKRWEALVEFTEHVYGDGDLLIICNENWNHETPVSQEERRAYGLNIIVTGDLGELYAAACLNAAGKIRDKLRELAGSISGEFVDVSKHGFVVLVASRAACEKVTKEPAITAD